MNSKRDPRAGRPTIAPVLSAAWNLLRVCWPTAALVCWLPLVKWGWPGGALRTVLFYGLFYGGGLLLSLVSVRHGGGWPRVRTLFRAPGAGVAAAIAGFAALMAISALLLHFSWPRTLLPTPLVELIALFDPRPVVASLSAKGPEIPVGLAIGWAGGAIAEEWMFRVALLWRWVAGGKPAEASVNSPGSRLAESLPLMGLKLVIVSAYFAALHWPQSIAQVTAAFLGGLAAGGALLRWRNFYFIAGLHVLFNWKGLSGV